jgi:hypothetical protein
VQNGACLEILAPVPASWQNGGGAWLAIPVGRRGLGRRRVEAGRGLGPRESGGGALVGGRVEAGRGLGRRECGGRAGAWSG